MKGSISITKPQGGDGGKRISIRVEDSASSTRVVVLEMKLEDFADAVTGMYSPCEITYAPSELAASRFGRELEGQTGLCEKVDWTVNTKETQAAAVREHFSANFEADGWVLFDDGTSSQQNGKMHRYNMRRWKDASHE